MSKNILVISVDIRETRVALIEGGIIAELHIERRGKSAYTVGNVYLGKVTRVLPGLQAAFVDIGQERAAFLHVEDLIRPDDFETYLAGGHKRVKEDTALPEVTGDEERDAEAEETLDTTPPPTAKSRADVTAAEDPEVAAVAAIEEEEEEEGEAAHHHAREEAATLDEVPVLVEPAEDSRVGLEDSSPSIEGSWNLEDSRNSLDALPEDEEEADSVAFLPSAPSLSKLDEDEDDGEDEAVDAEPPAPQDAPLAAEAVATDAPLQPPPSWRASKEPLAAKELEPLPDFPGMPGFTITDPNAPVPRAPRPPRDKNERNARGPGYEAQGRNAKRTRHRRGRDRDRGGRDREDRGGREGRDGRGGREGRERSSMPNRISKSTPIREVVREGQEIIVQVTKDPIGTKGARCSSHVSLPGRYVVYLPTVEHVGISKRIGSEKERARLREAIESVKPPSGGLIVRTVAEGLTKKQLKQDVGYLVRLWSEIAKKKEEGARAPAILMSELDLVLKTARDLFTDEVHQIVIDDRHQYERLCRFVEMFAPDRLKDIVYYSGDEPIFDAYGIEDEIGRALSRKVPLPSGGYLIIDQAEALTAIDVNTGRFVGKGSKDMEETILKTNL